MLLGLPEKGTRPECLFSCSHIILLSLLTQIPLSQHSTLPWITMLHFSCVNHFFLGVGGWETAYQRVDDFQFGR